MCESHCEALQRWESVCLRTPVCLSKVINSKGGYDKCASG